jgi:acetoin utilization deacetylase AcuC-like enzyme
MVHDLDYVRFVKGYCEKGGGFMGDSTYFSRGTFNVAMKAVGGALEATKMVVENDFSSSFALIRPPGHHATRGRFGGYCILNNAAIAAQYLISRKKLKRIMIVDWDSHAANGTMTIFYESPSVLLVSIHQDPTEYYPRDGFAHQIGRGEGRGYTINVEMPSNSGDEDYKKVMEEIVEPVSKQFKPQFVIGCCGFDTHWSDETSMLKLTAKGYQEIVSRIRKITDSLTIILEGGYSKSNGMLAHTVLRTLQDQKFRTKDDISKPNVEAKVEKKVSKIKNRLSEFYKF